MFHPFLWQLNSFLLVNSCKKSEPKIIVIWLIFFLQKNNLIWTLIWRYFARNIWFELWFEPNSRRDIWYKLWIENIFTRDLWFELWFENNLQYRIFELNIDLSEYWYFVLIWTLICRNFDVKVFDLIFDLFIF